MNQNLLIELQYIDTYAEENPKNYQIWHHRRVIVELLNDYTSNAALHELEFTSNVLHEDNKNYHAWSYRYMRILYIYMIYVYLRE